MHGRVVKRAYKTLVIPGGKLSGALTYEVRLCFKRDPRARPVRERRALPTEPLLSAKPNPKIWGKPGTNKPKNKQKKKKNTKKTF